MKVVILAGGLGTRISEESHLKPKPMIEIGGKPILWHIMKIYSSFGFNDFIICLGYKGYVIKEYFAHYFLYNSNVTFDFRSGEQTFIHENTVEPWRVTLIDTGLETMTGGRLKIVQPHVNGETFMLTYGDGVSDINISNLLNFHTKNNKIVTITSTQPIGRFGALKLGDGDLVEAFHEKPAGDGGWINAGFFIMQPEVFDYLEGDQTILEKAPLEKLADKGELIAYRHDGFWHPMDTLRDKTHLDDLLKKGQAPWTSWICHE